MNDLFADIGYRSMNKYGEELCGDHIDIMEAEDGSLIIVLADGMGSGVRASILSTLTAKIISTMIANGMNIEDCVETVAATLPLSPELGVAYSTFTILRIDNRNAEIIQYDNPDVILLRNGANMELHKSIVEIGGKAVSHARVELQENDIFIAMSDGCL